MTICEYVLNFAGEGYWIGDMYSLILKSLESFIEVLEDCVVMLSKENQELLYTEIPKLERFFRILTKIFSSQSGTINGQSEFIR
jgi:hypothetical protein